MTCAMRLEILKYILSHSVYAHKYSINSNHKTPDNNKNKYNKNNNKQQKQVQHNNKYNKNYKQMQQKSNKTRTTKKHKQIQQTKTTKQEKSKQKQQNKNKKLQQQKKTQAKTNTHQDHRASLSTDPRLTSPCLGCDRQGRRHTLLTGGSSRSFKSLSPHPGVVFTPHPPLPLRLLGHA